MILFNFPLHFCFHLTCNLFTTSFSCLYIFVLYLFPARYRISEEESNCEELEAEKRKVEEDCENLRTDIENLELNLQKVCCSRKRHILSNKSTADFIKFNRLPQFMVFLMSYCAVMKHILYKWKILAGRTIALISLNLRHLLHIYFQ